MSKSRQKACGVLVSCVLAFSLAFSMVGTAFAKPAYADAPEEMNYVSLGASNVNGYGMRGYMPLDVYDWPLLKEQTNIYGYKQDTPGSYPVLIEEYLEGQGYGVNLSQLAISSMRAEEVRFLLDDSFKGDAYTDWRFCDVEGYTSRNSQNWFYLAGKLEWDARGKAGTPTQEQAVEVLKSAYREAIANADLITVDIGVNNFGVYVSNQIVSKMYENDMNTIDPELAAAYEEGKKYAKSLLAEYVGADLAGIPSETLDHMVDTMAYALVGFCLSFDAVMEQIYALNPDANVVVVSIQNLMEGLNASIPGIEDPLPFGDIFGALVNAANVYTASVSEYCDKYYYADVRQNGHVEFFSDEILAYNGDPATLGQDMKDCFDIYDNDLYIKTRLQQFFAKMLYGEGLLDISAVPAGYDVVGNLEHFAMAYQLGLLKVSAYGGKTLSEFLNDGAAGKLAGTPFEAYYGMFDTALLTAYDVMAEIMQAGIALDTIDAASFGMKFGPIEDALLGKFFGLLEEAVVASMSPDYEGFTLQDNFYAALAAEAGIDEGVVNTVAALGIRTGIGNSFYGHPNGNGHVELRDAIISALENGTTGKQVLAEELMSIIASIKAIIDELPESASSAIKAKLDALKDMAEEHLDARADEASHGTYSLGGDSKYVAIGDAVIAGSGSYAEKLASHIAAIADEAEMDFEFSTLGGQGMFAEDILEKLESGEWDEALADADLVTLSMGAENLTTRINSQVLGLLQAFLNAEGYEPIDQDWASLLGEECVPYVNDALDEVYAMLLEETGDERTAALAADIVECYAYGYAGFAVSCFPVLNAIQEIAPEAHVVAVGLHNMFDEMVVEMEGIVLDAGEYVAYVIKAIDRQCLAYAMLDADENVTFVSAPEAASDAAGTLVKVLETLTAGTPSTLQQLQAFAAAAKTLTNLFTDPAYVKYWMPNAEGHEYIFGRILEAVEITAEVPEVTTVITSDDVVIDVDGDGAADASAVYTGSAIESVVVTVDGVTLVEGVDYTVTYVNNVNVGTATAFVTGMGAYSGTVEVEFEITHLATVDSFADFAEGDWYLVEGQGTFAGERTLFMDYALGTGLMGGYTVEGVVVGFGPWDDITRAQVATVLFRAACADNPSLIAEFGSTTDPELFAASTSTGFTDMELGTWYTAAINWAKATGIMKGDTSTDFTTVRPNDPVARQELCLMLARYVNGGDVPETALDPAKADGLIGMDEVADWARDGVNWAVNNGVIGGVNNGDGTFSMNPNDTTWRCAAAKMLAVTLRDLV